MPTAKRLTALNFFPAYQPPKSGGEHRYFHIYKNLGRHYRVDMVSPNNPDHPPETVSVGEGAIEHRVPKTSRHASLQEFFDRTAGFPECSAMVVSLASYREHEFMFLLKDMAAQADIVVHEFPFLFRHVRKRADQLLVYDAHNVEFDLQRSMLRGGIGMLLCRYVKHLERLACRESDVIFATSSEDRERLISLYRLPPGKVFVAPNGVDAQAIRFASEAEKSAAKGRLGLDGRDVMLFIGSFHPPNNEAVHYIISTLAPRFPDRTFLIVGTVTRAVATAAIPENVLCLGLVSDEAKLLMLQATDVALNPMLSGSGTNLKMIEYLAAGVPIVTTPVGARGLGLVDGDHAIVTSIADFPGAVGRALGDPGLRERLRERGRRLAEEKYDWRQIADSMHAVMESAFAACVGDAARARSS